MLASVRFLTLPPYPEVTLLPRRKYLIRLADWNLDGLGYWLQVDSDVKKLEGTGHGTESRLTKQVSCCGNASSRLHTRTVGLGCRAYFHSPTSSGGTARPQ